MIVVCSGCSAKFRVADEKVGPRGAKLRCSRCQTVFSVRRDVTPGPPEMVAAPPPATPPPQRTAPPPPVTAATPIPGGGPQFAADPFAVIAGLDRLAYHPATPAAPPPATAAPGAFEIDLDAPGPPPADPFDLPPEPQPGDDPFALGPDPIQGSEPLPPEPLGPTRDAGPPSAHLSLEEQTTPPPRKLRPAAIGLPEAAELGLPGMAGAMEDPFASVAPLEPGEPHLGGGDAGFDALSLPGLESGLSLPVEPPPAERPITAAAPLLHVDPFAAAAVKAPLLADEGRGAAPVADEVPAESTAERRAAGASSLRAVAVNAVSLVALLLLTLAIWLGWRGGLSPKDALRPTTIVAALRQQPAGGPLVTEHLSSGLYERERGTPLVFVRGMVASTAPVPLEGVRVSVELLRDGRVVARGDAPAGQVLGPETLFGIADAEALARAAAEAAERAPGRLMPGEVAPFLVAFVDQPGELVGSTVRVTASAVGGK